MVIVLHLYIVNDLLGLPGRVCRNIPSIVRWVISYVFFPNICCNQNYATPLWTGWRERRLSNKSYVRSHRKRWWNVLKIRTREGWQQVVTKSPWSERVPVISREHALHSFLWNPESRGWDLTSCHDSASPEGHAARKHAQGQRQWYPFQPLRVHTAQLSFQIG